MRFFYILLISAVVGVVGTGAGGLIVSLKGNPSRKLLSLFLGYSGGVMVSLLAFDLMPEALELGGTILPLVFLVLGAVTIMAADLAFPHSHHLSSDQEVFASLEPRLSSRWASRCTIFRKDWQ